MFQMTRFPKIAGVIPFLVSLLFMSITAPAQLREVSVVGRVTDSHGRPISHVDVYLEPANFVADGFDRLIESSVTGDDGRFVIKRNKEKGMSTRRWMLYVSLDRTVGTVSFLTPPFDMLRRYDKSFDGRPLEITGKELVNVGDLRVQFFYSKLTVDLSALKRASASGRGYDLFWNKIYFRILNKKGHLAEESSLSDNDVRAQLGGDDSLLNISLPNGAWKIQVLQDNKIIGSSKVFTTDSKLRKGSLILIRLNRK